MNEPVRKYHGHKTMLDGSHVPLTNNEAAAIMQAVETAGAERAQKMPTARNALHALIEAEQRMKELGWWLGGGLRVRPGDECAVAETGSTGMWRGSLDAERKYVHYGDYVTDPRKCWLKPIGDLTDDERAWMVKCDRREAEAHAAMVDRLTRPSKDEVEP